MFASLSKGFIVLLVVGLVAVWMAMVAQDNDVGPFKHPTPVPPPSPTVPPTLTPTPLPSPTPTLAPGQPVPDLTTKARRIAAVDPQGGAAPTPIEDNFDGPSGNAWSLSGNTIHFPHCAGRQTPLDRPVYDYYFLAMPHDILTLTYAGADIIHSFDRVMTTGDPPSEMSLTIGGNNYPAIYRSHYPLDCAYFGGATMQVTP